VEYLLEVRGVDPENPCYSLIRLISFLDSEGVLRVETPNHRLSRRKNLKTSGFELCGYYVEGSEQVTFAGSLEGCLNKAEVEWKR